MAKSTERRLAEAAAWVLPLVVVLALLPWLAAVLAMSAVVAGAAWVARWAMHEDRREREVVQLEDALGTEWRQL